MNVRGTVLPIVTGGPAGTDITTVDIEVAVRRAQLDASDLGRAMFHATRAPIDEQAIEIFPDDRERSP